MKKIIHIVRKKGIVSLFRLSMINISRGGKPLKEFNGLTTYFEGNQGLEIGGPSKIFTDKSLLPVYNIVGSCDNCNFSSETVWQRNIREGLEFKYHPNKPVGYQFVCEASKLGRIDNERYDFVMSSHVLEHMANPLKALKEWLRVLRNGGILLVIVPHKEATFDHARPRTLLSHLIEDYEKDVGEDDTSHFEEIFALHDLRLDPPANPRKYFIARTLDNLNNRCVHHHVWVTEDLLQLFDYLGLIVIHLSATKPSNIVIAGQYSHNALLADIHARNVLLKSYSAAWRKDSPFTIDKNQSEKPVSKLQLFLNYPLILGQRLMYYFRKT